MGRRNSVKEEALPYYWRVPSLLNHPLFAAIGIYIQGILNQLYKGQSDLNRLSLFLPLGAHQNAATLFESSTVRMEKLIEEKFNQWVSYLQQCNGLNDDPTPLLTLTNAKDIHRLLNRPLLRLPNYDDLKSAAGTGSAAVRAVSAGKAKKEKRSAQTILNLEMNEKLDDCILMDEIEYWDKLMNHCQNTLPLPRTSVDVVRKYTNHSLQQAFILQAIQCYNDAVRKSAAHSELNKLFNPLIKHLSEVKIRPALAVAGGSARITWQLDWNFIRDQFVKGVVSECEKITGSLQLFKMQHTRAESICKKICHISWVPVVDEGKKNEEKKKKKKKKSTLR
eukprot:Platyproteum_vivax@DN8613_c0_g1_i1.p1